ncbi:hypothetical protein [Hydrogenophaga sp. 5NK40-0174]|uniref:hypothetical protein n=1 Tax=Hydrogenophaga sp. 5NK40-0174 TaxID=3127649 RepID=UPI003109ECCB
MFFKLPWFKDKGPQYHDTQVLEMDFLVSEFEEAMDDIEDPMRNRLRAALVVCNTPKDLWFLRSKIFSLISKHHCEYEAHQRVARLDQKMRFFCEHHPEYVIDDLPSGPMALLH